MRNIFSDCSRSTPIQLFATFAIAFSITSLAYAESFNQSQWSGGSTTTTANATNHQSGWSNFSGADNTTNVINSGNDIAIAIVPDSTTQSTFSDFTHDVRTLEFTHNTTADFSASLAQNTTTVGINQILLTPSNNAYTWAAAPSFNGPAYSSNSSVSVTMADIDDDGDLDLLRGILFGYVHTYENTGSASSPIWTYRSNWSLTGGQGNHSSPTLADLDNDGDLDMLVGVSNLVRGYRNIGDKKSPIWQEVIDWRVSVPGTIIRPTLGDLDNDGDVDLLVGTAGSIRAFLNVGDATSPLWQAQANWDLAPGTGNMAPSLADMDGDNDLDIVYSTGRNLRGYRNTGSVNAPAWTATNTWDADSVGNNSISVQVVDFDGDADLDVMVGSGNGQVLAWANTATTYHVSGTFESAVIDTSVHSGYVSLNFTADIPANTTVDIDFRAGDTNSPDPSWENWQARPTDGNISALLVNQRYFQYRLSITNVAAAATVTPKIYSIELKTSNYPQSDNIAISDDTITLDQDFSMSTRGAYLSPNLGSIDVQGNYAYTLHGTGMPSTSWIRVLNISDPNNPSYITQTSHGARINDVYAEGNFLYVAATSNGIDIMSLSNPAAPTLIRRIDTPHWANAVYSKGNYSYVADFQTGGLQIIDKTIPASAALVGAGYNTAGDAIDVHVEGDYAYIADSPLGLVIIDISDKSNPLFAGSYGSAVSAVRVQGGFAYIIGPNFGFSILDVTNPAAVKLVASVPEITSGGVSIQLSGTYAYVTALGSVYAIDVRNPREPAVVNSIAVANARSLDVANNFAYVTTNDRMQVISLGTYNTATHGVFTSSVIDVGPNTGLTTLDFAADTPANTGLAVSVRAGATPTPEDGGWTSWMPVANSGASIAALGTNRFVQYQLVLTSSDASVSPKVSSVTVNFQRHAFETQLTSSAFNSTFSANLLDAINWTESLASSSDIQIQLRTAPNTAGNPGIWSEWKGPDGTNLSYWNSANTYSGNCSGTGNISCATMIDVFRDGIDDQWFQYKLTLISAGDATPILADITVPFFAGTTSGINVSISNASTSEATLTPVNFTVSLTGAPATDVSLLLYSTDPSEGILSTTSITFTNSDWANRQVTLTPVNDDLDDGNITYSIVIAASTSTDSNYHNINPADILITNIDDDVSNVEVTPTSGLVTQEDGSANASFNVRLTSQPSQPVTIPVTSSNPNEGTASTSSLLFNSNNWNAWQTVVVSGVEDYFIDGNVGYSIVLGVVTTTDPNYANLNPADVSITSIDTDAANIAIIPGGTLTTSENFGSASFTVALTSRPTSNILVRLSSSNNLEGVVLPSSMMFTTSNWNIPQTASVNGKDDNIIDGDKSYQILTSIQSFGDSRYSAATPSNIDAINLDNDGYTISVIAPNYGVITTEGGSGSFQVKLGTQPSAPVTVNLTSSDTTEGLVAQSITFLPNDDISYAKTVTISALDDDYFDGSQVYSVNLSSAISTDPNFNGRAPSQTSIKVTNRDNNYTTQIIDSDKSVIRTLAMYSPVMFGGNVTSGNFNNDAYTDIVVSEHIGNTSSTGGVFIYPGSATGYSKSNRISLPSTGANFGRNLAVGDVNKDGYDDLIVSMPHYRSSSAIPYPNEGRVQVHFGSATGLPSSPNWSIIGDQFQAHLGWSIAAEDLNGDGADEIIASTPIYDSNGLTNNGRVFIFNGVDALTAPGTMPSTTPTTIINGTSTNHQFGIRVAAGGDIDGDGFNDLLVGAHYRGNASTHSGTVYAYSGSPTGLSTSPTWSVSMANNNNTFGSFLTSAGDVNGDGIDDILVGVAAYSTPHFAQERAMVFFGQTVANGGPSTTPDWNLQTPYTSATAFGQTLTSLGDTNNDGYDDIFIGAPNYGIGHAPDGRGHIYLGSSTGPSLIPDWMETSGQMSGSLGRTDYAFSAAGLGDINNDGYDDFVVGAVNYDAGQEDEGAILIYTSIPQTIARNIEVTTNGNPSTSESGGSTSVNVKLTHPPTANVTVPLSSSDITEGTVSPTSLLFTTTNWHIPQTVTVTGVDDASDDGDINYVLIIGSATSTDNKYNGINADDITLSNQNNDRTISITTTDAIASEHNLDTASFTVNINSQNYSPLTVNYVVSGTATSGADFVPLNGNITIPAGVSSGLITITPLDDALTEGNETVTITLTTGSNYIVTINTATITLGDNDSPSIIVSPTSGLITTETGGTAQFSVALTSQPSANVVIPVSSNDNSEGMPSQNQLVFTPSNWANAQTVTVTGQDDSQVDANTPYMIILNTPATSDSNYSLINPDDVHLINQDDDAAITANVSIFSVNATTREGDVAPSLFRFTRTGSTAASLLVRFTLSGTAVRNVDYETSSWNSVTIPAGEFSTDVVISPKDDTIQENAESITFALTAGTGYIVDQPNAATIMLIDNDTITEPYVNFMLDQIIEEGNGFTVTAMLSNPALTYPVTIAYSVSGTALHGSDHNATDGVITINHGLTGSTAFTTVANATSESDENVIFSMGTITNAKKGARSVHSVTITETNIAPTVDLFSEQNAKDTRLIIRNGGNVTLTAVVDDANSADSHTYDWSLTNNNLVDTDANPAAFVFNPSGLTPGFYNVRVSVTDNGVPAESATVELLIEVAATAPTLSSLLDSDSDGINDSVESYGDSDGDGIADYQDNDSLSAHELQAFDHITGNYIMRTDVGLSLRLGVVAFAANSDGADVSLAEITNYGGGEGNAGTNPNDGIANSGGYFDYEIWGLSHAGQTARLTIPQLNPIPTGAVYRKYFSNTGWQLFVSDSKNNLASAAGAPGVCPPPGDSAYTTGLTAGHYCLQLTIEDGGPNDTDRSKNSVITDPGTLSLVETPDDGGNTPPGNIDDTPQNGANGGGGGSLTMLSLLLFMLLISMHYVKLYRQY